MAVSPTLNNDDLVIESYDPQPHGGQHVVKTVSGVRITHTPTGISVVSDSEKSQLRNREVALQLLAEEINI